MTNPKTPSVFLYWVLPQLKVSLKAYDLKLMRKHAGPNVQVKAAGGVRTLENLIKVQETGATRSGATATIKMMDDAKERFEKS